MEARLSSASNMGRRIFSQLLSQAFTSTRPMEQEIDHHGVYCSTCPLLSKLFTGLSLYFLLLGRPAAPGKPAVHTCWGVISRGPALRTCWGVVSPGQTGVASCSATVLPSLHWPASALPPSFNPTT